MSLPARGEEIYEERGEGVIMSAPQVNILLVDDQPENLLVSEAILASPEYHVVKATSGEAALQCVMEHDFAVIVLDVQMPGLDGLETARLIKKREQSQHLPIIFLTGTELEREFTGYAMGAVDYLIKPVHPVVLKSKIAVFAELYRQKERLAVWNETLEQRVAERTAEILRKDEELRTISQQLWQASKLATMGELGASIAHELNNPLATVSLSIESLLTQTLPDDPRRRTLEVIEQEVERMGDLVANLLQFSRRSQAQISSLDLRAEIERTLELIHYHLRNHRITIAREFAPDVPLVLADRQQLRQLFLNLFTNASDAMPTGGTLTIRLSTMSNSTEEKPEVAVVIEVSDTGVGIPAEDLPKVMAPFFTTKPEGKGTGLGLPICRRIMQEHYGLFDIISEVGKGTTARMVLPVAKRTNAAHV